MEPIKTVVRKMGFSPSSSFSSSCSFSSSSSSSVLTVAVTRMVTVMMVMVVVMVEMGDMVTGERILGEENDDFDFDGLPGVQHEFKVEVHAGAQDCFFQKVARGASVHVSFEVLRGGDHLVSVAVRNAHGQIVRAEHAQRNGAIEFESTYEETYAVCVDNTASHFSGKLVYLYIVAYTMEDWSTYSKEVDEIFFLVDNATLALANVEQAVQSMRMSQSQLRLHAMRDMYMAWSNQSYVQNWSLLQCLVIVAVSVVQVVFVRRLFRTSAVTPSAKPRA